MTFLSFPNRGVKGVVDEMFKKLSKESTKNGWPYVRWITAEDNYRGRRVYDRTADKNKMGDIPNECMISI